MSYNTSVIRNSTFQRAFIYRSGGVGTEINLTGVSAYMFLRNPDTRQIVLELTSDNGRIVLGGSAGTIHWLVDDDTISAMDVATYEYDMLLVFPDGTRKTPLAGQIEIIEEITVEP